MASENSSIPLKVIGEVLNPFEVFSSIRARVEPFLPAETEALKQFFPEGKVDVIEMISSQAAYPPSGKALQAIDAEATAMLEELNAFEVFRKENDPALKAIRSRFMIHKEKSLKEKIELASSLTDHPFSDKIVEMAPEYQDLKAKIYQFSKELCQQLEISVPAPEAPVGSYAPRILELVKSVGPETKGVVAALDKLCDRAVYLEAALDNFSTSAIIWQDMQPEEQEKLHTFFLLMEKAKSKDDALNKNIPHAATELDALTCIHLIRHHNIKDNEALSGERKSNNGGSWPILAGAVGTVTGAGQLIVTPELHWDGYNAIPERCEASLFEVPRDADFETYLLQKLAPDLEEKEQVAQLKQKVGCILLTQPCSITGKQYTEQELSDFAAIVKKYDIPLIVNEVYASPKHDGSPHISITRVPEFSEIEDNVMITGSLSKTFNQLNANLPKYAYCWSQNTQWAGVVSKFLNRVSQPFGAHDFTVPSNLIRSTDQDYFIANEKESERRRLLVAEVMEEVNQGAEKQVLGWHGDRKPDVGYIGTVMLDAAAVEKAGISNPFELWEYIYKTVGVSTGPVFFAERSPEEGKQYAVRINYSIDENQLRTGIKLLGQAVRQMEQGVTFNEVRKTQGAPREDFHLSNLIARVQAEFGGADQEIQTGGASHER